MPRNSTLRRGVSGRDALINSGGEQFLAEVESTTSPVTLTITFANLQDGTDFAGTSGFTGNPAWTSNATNYIWFDKNTSTLVNNSTGFPTTPNIIPLWRLALDVSGDFVSIFDSRPWFVQNAPNPNQGLEVDSTSLDIRNTNPTSSWVTCSDPDTELNWDLGSETLTVTTSDLRVTAFLDGAFHTNVVTAGSSISNVNGVSGDVIFVDLGGASGSPVSLQQSTAAAYTPQQNRVILGNRVGSDIIWNNKFLIRDSGASVEYIAQACGIGLSKDIHEALANAPTAPTSVNPFITQSDLGSGTGILGSAAGVGGVTGGGTGTTTILNWIWPSGAVDLLIQGHLVNSADWDGQFRHTINIGLSTHTGAYHISDVGSGGFISFAAFNGAGVVSGTQIASSNSNLQQAHIGIWNPGARNITITMTNNQGGNFVHGMVVVSAF